MSTAQDLILYLVLDQEGRNLEVLRDEVQEGYAKPSLKKYRPIAARNEDKKVFSGLL